MSKDEWKELFYDELYQDWRTSGSHKSFDNWCDEMWEYRRSCVEQ